jgi:predicted TIM-barrel fold metal-dependent hydrolase
MSVTAADRRVDQNARPGIVDCDIHPSLPGGLDGLLPYLDPLWHDHLATYGVLMRQAAPKTLPYPRMQSGLGRRDAWPPEGGAPGSSLRFMREQHLDPNGVAFGLLQPLSLGHMQRNPDFGAALCTAFNDWQADAWTGQDRRLKGAIVIYPDDAAAAVAEIRRCARNADFVQIAFPPRTTELAGSRRYWPIFEAAQEHDLPIGMHSSGFNGYANTGSGWPSYYIEDHYGIVQGMQAVVTSLVLSGTLERFPRLRVVLIEGGLGWIPALRWRLDKHWARMREEVPQVRRPPSDYVRENIWFTTQPIEEPPRPEDLLQLFDWIGWDRLLFSTDYPHWDFDDPKLAFRLRLPEARQQQLFRDNARRVYARLE